MDLIVFIIKSILLGIIEGITEFLPVSSTGHLVIVQNLINFKGVHPNYVEMYTYVIQLGAIFAVVILYWDKIKYTLVNFFPKNNRFETSGLRFWLIIVVACIPGGVVGVLLNDITDKYLLSPIVVALALFLGGIMMIYAEKHFRVLNPNKGTLNISLKQACIIGLFQCLAIIPGISRSASTITGGWIAGLSTVAATEFSFFLAIPVMVGMSTLKIIKIGGLLTLTSAELISLAVGFIVSFLVALKVINRFIAYLKQNSMKVFAIYRIVFAIIVLIAGYFGSF